MHRYLIHRASRYRCQDPGGRFVFVCVACRIAGRIELARDRPMAIPGELSPMSVSIPKPPRSEIVYPDSDGKPMADNTLQFRWIVTIKEGLDRVYPRSARRLRGGGPVLVSGRRAARNLHCPRRPGRVRPAQGRSGLIQAVGGRRDRAPGRLRGPLAQQPSPRDGAEARVLRRYGVQEYYIYDPDESRTVRLATRWTAI